MTPLDLALVVAAYLVGSLSSAILVSRAAGLGDPRQTGSGNPGATNMLRHAGRRAAALVFALDFSKGLLPTLLAAGIGSGPAAVAGTAIGACAGHIWPVYFGFRGGKAVATYAGASFGLSGALGLAFVAVWLAFVLATRISSVGALAACLAMPPAAWMLGLPGATAAAVTALSLTVVARHRSNIRKLIAGTEGRITR